MNNKRVLFYHGDISASPNVPYDVIAYNFSLQYAFESKDVYEKTISQIVSRSKQGTKFIGVIPDSEFIISRGSKYTDVLGNYVLRNEEKTGYGEFGEMVWVCVKGTLYYNDDEPITEPIAYKDILIQSMRDNGFVLDSWKPFVSHMTGYISDMYSEFIFTRV
jgi:hypothetical protein